MVGRDQADHQAGGEEGRKGTADAGLRASGGTGELGDGPVMDPAPALVLGGPQQAGLAGGAGDARAKKEASELKQPGSSSGTGGFSGRPFLALGRDHEKLLDLDQVRA